MRFITRFTPFLFAVILSFVTFGSIAQVASGSNSQVASQNIPYFAKMKEYRFPGGLCYEQRTAGMPDMFTYMTMVPELASSPFKIESCLKNLAKEKWSIMQLDPASAVNTLREARTKNMTCTEVGVVQMPLMFVIRFSNYELTGKSDELEQCLLDMHNAKEQVSAGFHQMRSPQDL